MQSRFSLFFSFLLLPAVVGGGDLLPPGDLQGLAGVVARQEQAQGVVVRPAGEIPEAGRRSELTAELVYAVVVGQIAGQRSDHRTAFTHFLRGARLARDPRLAELAANAALVLDDAAAVQQTAEVWLELAPKSIGAHQLAAYARFEADDVAAATEHLRRIIALAPAVTTALANQASALSGSSAVRVSISFKRRSGSFSLETRWTARP